MTVYAQAGCYERSGCHIKFKMAKTLAATKLLALLRKVKVLSCNVCLFCMVVFCVSVEFMFAFLCTKVIAFYRLVKIIMTFNWQNPCCPVNVRTKELDLDLDRKLRSSDCVN